jgi:hypothetical protein
MASEPAGSGDDVDEGEKAEGTGSADGSHSTN